MPRFALLLVALTTTGLLAPSASRAADPVKLRYKTPKGTKLPGRTSTKMEQSVAVAGQEFETSFEMTDLGIRESLGMTEAGHLKLKFMNKSLVVKSNMGPAGKYTYDSNADDKERGSVLSKQLNPVFEAMTGAEYTCEMSPRGEIKKVEGYGEILKAALQDNPLAKSLGENLEKNMSQNLGDMLPVWPEDAVRVGQSWEAPYKMELPQLGKAEGKRKYTVDKITETDGVTKVTVSVTQEMSFDIEVKNGPAVVTGKLSITEASGQIVFNATAGHVHSSKVDFTLKGDLTTEVNGMNIGTDLTQKQSVNYQHLDKLPE